MQSVGDASFDHIDMCLILFCSEEDTRAAKMGEVCEHQEESSKVETCWEGKLREVEGLNVCAKGPAACDGGPVQNRGSLSIPLPGVRWGIEL